MKDNKLKIKVTLTEDMLGTCSSNPELHEEFVASKSADADKMAEEMAALPSEEAFEKALTIFPRNAQKQVIMWDYQFRGFLKESLAALTDIGETPLTKWGIKRAVDRYVFVTPRQIVVTKDGNPFTGKLERLTRPLRATTLQGDRVALATSEVIPAGSEFTLQITLLGADKKGQKELDIDNVKDALNYGKFKGLLQWSNGGFGRFTWEEVK
jgi:hypothetical protein